MKRKFIFTKKISLKNIILWLGVMAFIAAIYILSGQEGADSHRLSRGVIKEVKAHTQLPDILKHLKSVNGFSYDFILRKCAHFTLFFLLAVLIFFVYQSINRKRTLMISFISCAFFASMDELHQMFVAGRSARFADIIIDMCGASLAIILISILKKNSNRKICDGMSMEEEDEN